MDVLGDPTMDLAMSVGPFAELGVLLLACALLGAVCVALKQPVLITYLVAGLALGPSGLDWVRAHSQIELLAELGVTVLLFIVGLKLDLRQVRHIGPVALATGLGQLGFTIAIGFALTLAFGKGWIEALYIAIALTFSSTVIIVKLLSDKRELDTLHGRIAIGFLIVQDLAVVLAMTVVGALDAGGPDAAASVVLGGMLLRLGAAGVATFLAMRFLLPWLVPWMARSRELLLLFSLAWGVALAALGDWLGFSKEAGAFLAGFSLASMPYRDAVGTRLTGIRDFLLLFFFIDLGTRLDLATLGDELAPAITLSAFVLIGNPLIVMGIMGFMGYRKRTGFLAGLTVAQISEFSIVFIGMGISLGHVTVTTLGLTTLVGLVTIVLSTYLILYAHGLYRWLSPWLGIFERTHPFREAEVEESDAPTSQAPEVLVFGLGRYGSRLLRGLQAGGVDVLGVDFDPNQVRRMCAEGLPVRFGDVEDSDFIHALPLQRAKSVVLAVGPGTDVSGLVAALRGDGFTGKVTLIDRGTFTNTKHAIQGVDAVFEPFEDAADHAVTRLLSRLRPGTA